jgi:Zn ribbon nucleic-acid-binding protein
LAFYLFVCRGCKEGRALDNWLEAETQLKECLFCD